MMILILILVGGALAVVYTLRRGAGSSPLAISARIGRYGLVVPLSEEDRSQAVSKILAPGRERQQQSSVSESVERFVGRGRIGQGLFTRLERAGLKMTPGEFISLCLAAAMGAMALGLVIKGVLGLVLFGALAMGAPWIYLSRRTAKRRKQMLEQLADLAQMMGNSMRAGFSIMQSLDLVANEAPAPASEEFERVVTEVKLGLPLETALDHLKERMPSEDIELMIVAIGVQRQIGGNLAEILTIMSKTIRERVRFQRDLRTMTAQARYSSYIITALPIIVAVIINVLNHDYEMLLYTTSIGHMMLGGAVFLLVLGFFFLNRIAKIEV
jgi:tight adherence protein B